MVVVLVPVVHVEHKLVVVHKQKVELTENIVVQLEQ